MKVEFTNIPPLTDNQLEFASSAVRVIAENNFNLPYYRDFIFIEGVRYRITIQREDKK